MSAAYILIVVALNSTWSSPGSSSYRHDSPTVTMQEFSKKESCVFARDVIIRRAGGMKSNLNIVCVPKG